MKKICSIIFIAGMLSSGLFAEGKIKFLSAHFSVPIGIENVTQGGVEQSTVMTSIGFGLDAVTLISEKAGVYVNLDFFLPQRISITQRYQEQTASAVFTRNNYNSIWGVSALMGPAFVVSRSEKMMFTISPGIHYSITYVDGSSISVTHMFGIGSNLQGNIFFSSSGFFMFGADVVYDFYGRINSAESGRMSYWTLKPNIGIGFNF